jgi:G patch domain-containing protein 1
MRILKKMGWRPGHGIGPKVTFEQRKRQEQLSFVAPSLLRGQTISTLDDTDEEAKKHMYPPLNTVVPVLKRKENSHGLGFIPGKGLNEIVASGLDGGAKKGPNISGMSHVFLVSDLILICLHAAGFGLGALNDADEDDLDVYDNGMHASSSSRRLAFDDDDDDERIAMGPSRNRNQPVRYHISSVVNHSWL